LINLTISEWVVGFLGVEAEIASTSEQPPKSELMVHFRQIVKGFEAS
jgi:hypothetical protein